MKSASPLLCLLLAIGGGRLQAQAVRVVRSVPTTKGVLGGSITVTASPAFVSFHLVANGVAASSGGVEVTTTWAGFNHLSRVNLYGYFFASAAALTGGTPPVSIPSAAVLGQVPGGSPSSFAPFTQGNPVPGASLLLYREPAMPGGSGSRVDILNMEIDLRGLTRLPAGTYTGTLYLQAQML